MKFAKRGQKMNRTKNLAGGEAFTMDEKLEIVSILVTSFCGDQYYRTGADTMDRLVTLIQNAKDKKFAAKAAIYAREKGMRSITHVALSNIANSISGQPWVRKAINRGIFRVDDMTEMVAYYWSEYGKPIPKSLQRGIADAFAKFDRYQLAKYRGEGQPVSLIDVVNMCHPRPVEKNAEALHDLVKGKLRSETTWEAKISQTGQDAKSTDKSVEELKEEAWEDLILSKKIGYFALLKNLRNIEDAKGNVIKAACSMLTNKNLILQSRVLPFRFATAYDNVGNTDMLSALSKALDISCWNVPRFNGKTLVIFDASASMRVHAGLSKKSSTLVPLQVAALFSAILAKANKADVMHFASLAKYIRYNPDDSTLTLSNHFIEQNKNCNGFYDHGSNHVGHGTNFNEPFKVIDKKYDRIFIFSDQQGWEGCKAPTGPFSSYCRRHKVKPYLYCIDLCGYGSMQFPQDSVYFLSGLSNSIFDIIQAMEADKQAIIKEIEAIKF